MRSATSLRKAAPSMSSTPSPHPRLCTIVAAYMKLALPVAETSHSSRRMGKSRVEYRKRAAVSNGCRSAIEEFA